MIKFITLESVAANTFERSLYKHPRREIGQYSFKDTSAFTFGIEVTKYERRLFGSFSLA